MIALRYFERRVLHSGLLLLVVTILTFGMAQLAPGSFADDLALNPQISPQTRAALRAQYGIGQPITARYLHWIGSMMHGDFGYSLAYNLPVRQLLWPRLRNTLLLGVLAMLTSWAIALPLGAWSARACGGWMDRSAGVLSVFLLAAPEIVLALLFVLIAARTGILPTGGMISGDDSGSLSTWRYARDVAQHLVIPVLVLTLSALPVLFRHVRGSMLEAFNTPSIQATRGHGIGELRLLIRHALPQAANPLISLFGLSLAGILSGSFLVEVICGWPGLGPWFLQSIFVRDFQVVVAIVTLFSLFLILGNVAADVLLYAVDPRIRVEA